MKKRVSTDARRRLWHWLAVLMLTAAGGVAQKVAAANSQVTLLSENTSTRAIALEAVTLKAGPFGVTSAPQFGSDNRTRIVLFALNVALFPNEGVSSFTADLESLEGGQAKIYQATVENIGAVPEFPGLMQITVRLPDNLPANVGDVLMRVNWRGAASNRVRVAIGQTGGGPADDAGSVPTPAPVDPPAAPPTATPDPFAPGTISYADAKRFLEQATFGPTDAEITRVRAMGYQAWLEEQFAKPEQPYPVLSTDISADSSVSCPTTLDATARAICLRDNYAAYQLQKFMLQRALYGDDQLRQRTAWAWHKILVVSHRDINVTHWMLYYLKMLDRNAFGNYRTMLTDLTLNPAMGNYLDMVNNINTATSPANENYAREILQLFSIGLNKLNRDGTPQRDANGNTIPTYDQNTVTGFAKVFTGWQFTAQRTAGIVNYVDPMAVANENRHDRSTKQLLDGVTLAANRTSAQDLNDALNNIFANASLAPLSQQRVDSRAGDEQSFARVCPARRRCV